ncbi:zinc-binding dehydrogenase [Actinocorallia aurea]
MRLAVRADASVTATASPRSADRVRGYGAETVVHHTVRPVPEAARGPLDVVVNLVPNTPEEAAPLAALTADGGAFVSATTPPAQEPGRGVRVVRMAVRGDAAQLAGLLAKVAAGEVSVHVASVRALADLATVHTRFEQGVLPGKTVIVA